MNRQTIVFILATLLASPAALAGGNAIEGYLQQGMYTPISGTDVQLYDRQGGLLNTTTSSWSGAYEFEDLEDGTYILKAGQFAIPVSVAGDDVRQDIDFNAADGRMSYGNYALQEAMKLVEEASKPQPKAKGGGGGNIYSNDGSLVSGGGCTYVSSGGMSMKSCD